MPLTLVRHKESKTIVSTENTSGYSPEAGWEVLATGAKAEIPEDGVWNDTKKGWDLDQRRAAARGLAARAGQLTDADFMNRIEALEARVAKLETAAVEGSLLSGTELTGVPEPLTPETVAVSTP